MNPPAPPETNSSSCCDICRKSSSKYQCPRCKRRYCALACYQSAQHRECSELFYRDNVEQHLAASSDGGGVDEELRNRMIRDMMEESIINGGGGRTDVVDADEPLEARLDGVDLNEVDVVWFVFLSHTSLVS